MKQTILSDSQFYQTKWTIVTANVSNSGPVTPIGGNQAKEDTHDVVLILPAKLKPGALSLNAVPSLTVYEGENMPGPNCQADSAW